MCLQIKSGPHVAEKDMLVLKLITKDNYSMYMLYPYTANSTYTAKFSFDGRQIYDGLHSYDASNLIVTNDTYSLVKLRLARANGIYRAFHIIDVFRRFKNIKLVEFTIPAGATYYIGVRGDLVSDTIRTGSLDDVTEEYAAKPWPM